MSDLIQQIKQRLDLTSYAESRGVELKRYGTMLKGLCPFHQENTPSFVIYEDTQTFCCFGAGCNAHGDVIDYYALEHKISNEEAIKALAAELHIRNEPGAEEPDPVPATSNRDIARSIVTEYAHEAIWQNNDIIDYLHNRDVTDDDIKLWKIGAGTGRMHKDLEDRISHDVLMDIGIIYEKNGKIRDYIWNTMLIVPVINTKGKINHWWLRDINDKNGPQMKSEHRESDAGGDFFNVQDILKNDEIFLVEGFFEVNQIVKRGRAVTAIMGTASKKQLNFLVQQREINVVYEEEEDANGKIYNIWLDRDDKPERPGQRESRRIANELYKLHRTSIWKCPMGKDPDEYLREGGKIEDIEHEVIHRKQFDIEKAKGQYWAHRQGKTKELTNFILLPKYKVIDDEDMIRRLVRISGNGTTSALYELRPGDDMSSKRAFNRWLMNRGNYMFHGDDADAVKLFDYFTYTDISKEVRLTQDMGNIHDNIWVYQNGAIVDGEVNRADGDDITWINKYDIEGIKVAGLQKKSRKRVLDLFIPEDYYSITDIVGRAKEFYPDNMIRIMIGYAASCICMDEIVAANKFFPLMMLFGQTTHGKTRYCDLIRSLLGAGNIPADTCKTTEKAYMRDMSKYYNLPMHLSEYNVKFEAVLRDLFDRNLYKQAKMTQGKETYNPGVNASSIFTSETTPSSMSLLNRCIIVNFNEFKYNSKLTEKYKTWWGSMVTENRGVGFLIRLLKTNIQEIIMDRIKSMERMMLDQENWEVNSRTVELYSIIMGAFCAVHDVVPELHEHFPNIDKHAIVKETKKHIDKTVDVIAGQDRLGHFFKYFHVLYMTYQDRFRKTVTMSQDGRDIIFDMESVYNEVMQYDRRSRNILEGTQKEDIIARAESRFDPNADSDKPHIRYDKSKRAMVASLSILENDFGVSFENVYNYDKVKENENPPMPF